MSGTDHCAANLRGESDAVPNYKCCTENLDQGLSLTADDISIISNDVLISQEVTLDEYAAGQSMKEHYDNSQKEYLEYFLNVNFRSVFFITQQIFFCLSY